MGNTSSSKKEKGARDKVPMNSIVKDLSQEKQKSVTPPLKIRYSHPYNSLIIGHLEPPSIRIAWCTNKNDDYFGMHFDMHIGMDMKDNVTFPLYKIHGDFFCC